MYYSVVVFGFRKFFAIFLQMSTSALLLPVLIPFLYFLNRWRVRDSEWMAFKHFKRHKLLQFSIAFVAFALSTNIIAQIFIEYTLVSLSSIHKKGCINSSRSFAKMCASVSRCPEEIIDARLTMPLNDTWQMFSFPFSFLPFFSPQLDFFKICTNPLELWWCFIVWRTSTGTGLNGLLSLRCCNPKQPLHGAQPQCFHPINANNTRIVQKSGTASEAVWMYCGLHFLFFTLSLAQNVYGFGTMHRHSRKLSEIPT